MNLFESQHKEFIPRHIGPNASDTQEMLSTMGVNGLDELIDKTVPPSIRMQGHLNLPPAMSEHEYLSHIKEVSLKNMLFKTYIGQGYYDTITPSVILRNVFENPGWYTQYTPYQAEISQGRLESLLNFQTMVSDLTALPIANASLLDEATAAAEAMTIFFNTLNKDHDHITRPKFFVDREIFPQTKDVLFTRAVPVGIEIVEGDYTNAKLDESFFGAIVQYPNDKGSVEDYSNFVNSVHAISGYVVMATDLLALTLLTPPGELGADAAVGSAQRFGVPLGYGGPHAAFFAAKDEFKRNIPGRIIGISVDANGNRALRMALQTREQHIKREKATSNICTAQALLANMAAMYAVYHGPIGLKNIARRIHSLTSLLADKLHEAGLQVMNENFFDTVTIKVSQATGIRQKAEAAQINFRYFANEAVGISLDETTTIVDVEEILKTFGVNTPITEVSKGSEFPAFAKRASEFLKQEVFNRHHS